MAGEVPNEDNFVDAIVYACFALVLMREAFDTMERHGLPVEELNVERLLNADWPWEG